MLTQSRLKEVLSYDPATGVFVWVKRMHSRVPAYSVAGTPHKRGYLCITIDGKKFLAHRLAWFYATGEWPKFGIDHVNGKKSDNSFDNLRDVSQSENMHNIHGLVKRNKTGFMGIFPSKRKSGGFIAQIVLNNKSHYLGTFNTAEEAATAYRTAKKSFHPTSPI